MIKVTYVYAYNDQMLADELNALGGRIVSVMYEQDGKYQVILEVPSDPLPEDE